MTTRRRPRSTFEIDTILRGIGQHQLGLITVAQATAAGVDKFAMARRRESGALVRVFTEVARLAATPKSSEQRILAGALAVPGSVVCAVSAAVVHGLPLPANTRLAAPIVFVNEGTSARTAGVSVIRSSFQMPTRPWLTTRVATPAATLLQLARFVTPDVVERCLDQCLAHRLVSVRSMQELIEAVPARAAPGKQMLVKMLTARSHGIGHRSGLERTVAAWLDAAGVDSWTCNYRVQVGNGRTIEVDFGWPTHRVALEISPFFTHGSRAQQERDAQRRRLLVLAGWRVVEATDPQLTDRNAFAAVATSVRAMVGDAPGSSALSSAQSYPLHNFHRPAV